MAGLYEETFVEELRQGALGLLDEWQLSPATTVTLLNLSENATFCADDPSTERTVVFRVHRPAYHSADEIASELAWIEALRGSAVVETPAPLEKRDGGYIAGFDHHGERRHVVAFDFMSGAEPDPETNMAAGFRKLGAISARLHAHARQWERPAGFQRKTWDFEAMFGSRPLWGDWREGMGLDTHSIAVLERVADKLKHELAAYGAGKDRFGLVHADLRLANLLVEEDRLGVIDFDDCGFSWFVYDFATAVSFLEHEPYIPELADAWIEGYRSVAPLSAEHAAMIPTFVMARRLLLTAWIASHAETETAQELGADYTHGTLELGERFLSKVVA